MTTSDEEKIEQQRRLILAPPSSVHLFAPCKIGEGILRFTEKERAKFVKFFQQAQSEFTFFIPASGSGSRMFSFLFDIIDNASQTDIGQIERFMNRLQDFAFFQLLPLEWKQKIRQKSVESDELSAFLLDKNGLNFARLPKGLIPFHYSEPFVLNPFQEHILQGTKLSEGKATFHFTIQEQFREKIHRSIINLEGITGKKYTVDYSIQQKHLDSFAFYGDGQVVLQDGLPIRRPSGHGSLLPNLNSIASPLIFIKNIDNVQHFSYVQNVVEEWSILGGVLLHFQHELRTILQTLNKQKLVELNAFYQFLSPSELASIDSEEQFRTLVHRPIRVCGVVRNEGQPGGGPFWVVENGKISKQIIEKAQIVHNHDQVRLMIKSTHFNPVMIALSPYDLSGNKHDLELFKDPSKYFVVNKTHDGQNLQYIEHPGLWNGSMANWNTVFVEIPPSIFSPVKNVLDLLDASHFQKQ